MTENEMLIEAQIIKLLAESSKIHKETTWYTVTIAISLIGVGSGLTLAIIAVLKYL